jgi:tight adherence protein B
VIPIYYGLVAAVFLAVFALVMATLSSSREKRERLAELRRRLGAREEFEIYTVRNRVARLLAEAGLAWTPRELATRMIIGGGGGTLFGIVLTGGAFHAVLCAAIGLGFLPLWVMGKRSERLNRCDEQLSQALQLMILALRAGHALPGALALAARESPAPVRDELRRAVDEHGLGRPLGQVVTNLAERLPTSDAAQTFAVAVLVLEQTGGNLIEVLDRLVENARARTQYRAKLRALTTQGRWSAWILCGMPFAFAAIAAILDATYLPNLMAHTKVIALFFALWIPGLLWTFRLVNQARAAS